jgi:hypothetical protein
LIPLSFPSQNHRYTEDREIPNRFATSRGRNNLSFSIRSPFKRFPSCFQKSWQWLRRKAALVPKAPSGKIPQKGWQLSKEKRGNKKAATERAFPGIKDFFRPQTQKAGQIT